MTDYNHLNHTTWDCKFKGKSAIWVAQNIDGRGRNFTGAKFWARGYFVSTVGRDEELIRRYIRDQEIADKQLDQQQTLFT